VRRWFSLAGRLVMPYDVDDTLQELAERATAMLGICGSAVSLATGDRLAFATAVPETVAALEHAQAKAQEGPCVQAYRTGEVVAIPDLARMTEGWDAYRATAAELGIGAVAGIPMRLDGTAVGALNLYAAGARDWSEEDLRAVHVLADMCTGLLVNSSRLQRQQQLTEQLQHALDSRVVIEQAKGIVAQVHNEDVGQAFERIRRHARNNHVGLRSVASAIVDLGLRL
jgi:GAF domain-containing protein